ncbi:MAG TPA: response regulator transcription factor [Kribbellaceae bacterium]|nr:response regulator transcription factor [Kribbellaceae bacterium]
MNKATARTVKVVVGDRQPLVCEGLVAVLERTPDMSVVDAVHAQDQLLAAVRQRAPDVIVIGHEPPFFDGVRFAQELDGRPWPIMLLERSCTKEILPDALHAGVRGILYKDQAPQLLAPAVRGILQDAMVIALPAMSHLVDHMVPGPISQGKADVALCLSRREVEVLQQVAGGLANHEIAEKLSVSVATVKSHLYSACRKLGLRDRAQAVIMAYETGLVRPGGVGPGRPGLARHRHYVGR